MKWKESTCWMGAMNPVISDSKQRVGALFKFNIKFCNVVEAS